MTRRAAHSRVRVVALALSVLFVVSACGEGALSAPATASPTSLPAEGVTITRLQPPPGELAQVAWVGDSLILQVLDASAAETGEPWSSRLWQLPLSRMTLRELPIAYDRSCGERGRYAFESPARVSETVFMYMQRCARLEMSGEASAYHAGTLMTFDLLTQRPPVAVKDQMDIAVSPPLNTEINGILLDPERGEMTVVQASDPDHNYVSALDGQGVRYLETGSMQIWGLSRSATGMAAFVGRPASSDEPGTGKASLYVSAHNDLSQPREVMAGIQDLVGTAWSHDGHWVAFGAKFKGQYGLYVVQVDSQEVRLVAQGRYWPTGSSWSPTSDRIAQPYELADGSWEIQILDVTALLAK